MKIVLIISTDTLGDDNTDDDNERYVSAVHDQIQTVYPAADIYVELTSDISSTTCYVSDDDSNEIAEEVTNIANTVWDKAAY